MTINLAIEVDTATNQELVVPVKLTKKEVEAIVVKHFDKMTYKQVNKFMSSRKV